MRISGPGRTVGPAGSGPARRAEGTGATFAPAEQQAPSRASSNAPVSTLAGLDALIALQAVDGDAPRKKRRAVKRGHDLLDVLEEMRIALLSGAVTGEMLDRIAMLIGGLEPSGDDGLDALIADISMRAEVELAKRGRYLGIS